MVDISMCSRRDCPRKSTCYRYLAYPSEYQTFIILTEPDVSNCEYYWRCRNPRELREMNKLNKAEGDE